MPSKHRAQGSKVKGEGRFSSQMQPNNKDTYSLWKLQTMSGASVQFDILPRGQDPGLPPAAYRLAGEAFQLNRPQLVGDATLITSHQLSIASPGVF